MQDINTSDIDLPIVLIKGFIEQDGKRTTENNNTWSNMEGIEFGREENRKAWKKLLEE